MVQAPIFHVNGDQPEDRFQDLRKARRTRTFADVSDADVVRRGVLVASVKVKAPRDPNQTLEPDEEEDVDDDQEIDLVTGEVGLHSTPVVAGDTVIVDVTRRDASGQTETHPDVNVELGAKANPPGFDEHLLGLEVGATKTFSIQYPAEAADFQGRNRSAIARVENVDSTASLPRLHLDSPVCNIAGRR
jgi:hypothetical protein